MKKVKVAVIGYGHLGKWHAQKAHQLEGSELVAIVEPSESGQKLAAEAYPDCRVVSSLSEIIDDIDAGIIVTPTSHHYEGVKTLLQKNKHVFCEKPLCSTLEDATDLKNYIENEIVQVGHSERCHQIWEVLAPKVEKIKSKKMIKIDRYAAFKGRATDVDVVSDLMIHDLDLMLFLFKQKPVKISSLGHKIRTDKWDHVTSHFFFANGDEAIITSGRNHVKEVRSLEVMSADGCYFVDLFESQFHHATSDIFEDDTYTQSMSYEKRDHLLLEQESFYNSVLENKAASVTYQDGVDAVYLVSKVLESLESSEPISL